ncbi:glycosyl transferase [Hahella sp. CCB-MM4]|uniref:glycosyltransferase family 2 protein n=1 Tax=Hahella sp. (strain CCB-MM4) TaxID=1926491 RepID=UPI000B9B2E99|nr:glycosyltransferase family 2 protein [Hahella sp. CCB-MM4]OZG70503.1 glycosyl transferase [Hahella sp. CCB-MM4]
MESNKSVSCIIPAKNEAAGLTGLLPRLVAIEDVSEIIVVDDGSTDDTVEVCKRFDKVRVISHPYSQGNGSAIKTGARNATGEIFVFLDADGQHNPDYIPSMLEKISAGYDLVVGSRGSESQASLGRLAGNSLYNALASWMVGHKIEDLTSGFRAVRADKFREFIYLLPNGFSYPTTSTMAFFRSGYSVYYLPMKVEKRVGKSHINLLRDGIRFLLIIFKIGTLYSPLKMFTPISFFFFSVGVGYYLYTYMMFNRFTNMSALLLITSVLVFLIGLVSEQVTLLLYSEGKNTKGS